MCMCVCVCFSCGDYNCEGDEVRCEKCVKLGKTIELYIVRAYLGYCCYFSKIERSKMMKACIYLREGNIVDSPKIFLKKPQEV